MPPPGYYHCRGRHVAVATATPLLMSRTMSALKWSSGTSVYIYDRAHLQGQENTGRPLHRHTVHPQNEISPVALQSIFARASPNGTTLAVYCMQNIDDPSVMKRYICILQHTSYNQYTFPIVKQMSNYTLLNNCKF